MARYSLLAHTRSRLPQTPEQVRACDHVRSVFGWSPDSIRSLTTDGQHDGPYAVRVRGDIEDSLEFICAEGFLIGIPPGGSKH